MSSSTAAVVARWDTSTVKKIAEIRRIWGDTLEKNLAVAHIVNQLYLGKADYDDAHLPFQYSWFRRLKKIAAHPEINDPQYREILPDARRTLYAISKLKSRIFKLALRQGMIHPHITAEEIEQWYKHLLGAPDRMPLKLTIRAKVPKKDEEEPNEEDRDILVSRLRQELEAVGFHLSDRNVHDAK